MTSVLAVFSVCIVRAKGVLNMLMMSISAMGIVTVLWVLFGYSMSFGGDKFGVIGDPTQYWGITGLHGGQAADADRLKFGAWLPFAGLWAIFVYFPVAHWVFAFDGFTGEHGGWIANKLKAIDFAGGTAVHINSGAAALALCIVLGKRKGVPTPPRRPANLSVAV